MDTKIQIKSEDNNLLMVYSKQKRQESLYDSFTLTNGLYIACFLAWIFLIHHG